MSTPLAVAALIVQQTAAEILDIGLQVAEAVGLPVSTWRPGDPTRSLYKYLARVLENLEGQNSELAKSAFVSTAEGAWLEVKAIEDFGVTPNEATYSTPAVTIKNTGTKQYHLDPGDLVAKASSTGKTFHSTIGGTWVTGTTLTINFVADEAGSASSVGVNDVDQLVTTFLGLGIVSSTASAGQDQQDDEGLRQACRDTLGALSPNGPDEAYEYVAKNSELTGNVEITRAHAEPDSDDLTVAVYVAGNAGPVSSAALMAAQNAIEEWATPLCVRPTVLNAVEHQVVLIAQFFGPRLGSDFATRATDAWTTLITTNPIGGAISLSTINQVLRNAVPEATDLEITQPASDLVPNSSEVLTVDVVTITGA